MNFGRTANLIEKKVVALCAMHGKSEKQAGILVDAYTEAMRNYDYDLLIETFDIATEREFMPKIGTLKKIYYDLLSEQRKNNPVPDLPPKWWYEYDNSKDLYFALLQYVQASKNTPRKNLCYEKVLGVDEIPDRIILLMQDIDYWAFVIEREADKRELNLLELAFQSEKSNWRYNEA